jgi:hypothetical protein
MFAKLLAWVIGLPIVVVAMVFVLAVFQGFCMWLPWTYYGIGAKYFTCLPAVWHAPSLWDTTLLMCVINTLKPTNWSTKKA